MTILFGKLLRQCLILFYLFLFYLGCNIIVKTVGLWTVLDIFGWGQISRDKALLLWTDYLRPFRRNRKVVSKLFELQLLRRQQLNLRVQILHTLPITRPLINQTSPVPPHQLTLIESILPLSLFLLYRVVKLLNPTPRVALEQSSRRSLSQPGQAHSGTHVHQLAGTGGSGEREILRF